MASTTNDHAGKPVEPLPLPTTVSVEPLKQEDSAAGEHGSAAAAAPDAGRQAGPGASGAVAQSKDSAAARRGRGKWLLPVVAVAVAAGAVYVLVPAIETTLETVSTDDAYVNGHVTFVAPRVAGQVSRVLVDDNMRVRQGDLLVELDPEPYQVQVAIKKAAVEAAEADLVAAQSQVRGLLAQARSNRFKLEHAIESVNNQLALLKSNVAQLKVEQATLALAERDFGRSQALVAKGAASQQQHDQDRAALEVARNRVSSADQMIQQTRAGLGLPINHEDPLNVPENLDQTFSTVRQVLGELMQSAAQFGYFPDSWDATPKETLEAFYKQDPEGKIDRIFSQLIPRAPAIKQAEARLLEARRDLEEAELNLRYCQVVAEIDGVVTRRNVNPGNHVQVGENLMAVRSLTEIWIDANFKETQLADLRIGQRVRCEIDMYGRRREYEGRITGFTMGTGQTLALLPAQNATGNFVKIVQRLPVRIELTEYDPDSAPLFVGLSVVPHVYFKEPPTGPNAGDVLQPLASLP